MISSVAIGIEEYSSRNMSSRGNESASGSDQHNLPCLQFDEMVSCRDEYALKARKPYTITKQREKWTDEEHKRFVEALKLYGRAWRRIEEHLGTKTAVQIRSHAQKFFSKVGRVSNANFIEPIEIPPPRPKRKPMHPYPRKLVIPCVKETLYSELDGARTISKKENQSPTSVLSVVGSDAFGSTASNSPRSSSDEHCSLRNNIVPSEESNHEDSTRTVKLFGKTVSVADCHISSSICNVIELKPVQPVARKFIDGEDSSRNSGFSWPNAWTNSSIVQAKETKLQRQKSSVGSNSGSVNYTGNVEDNPDVETQSSLCFPKDGQIELTRVSEFRTSERSAFSQLRPKILKKNKLKGFVPYQKRRVAKEEETKFSWTYPHKDLEPETSLCL